VTHELPGLLISPNVYIVIILYINLGKNRLTIPTPILIPTKVVRLTTGRSRMTIEKIAVIKFDSVGYILKRFN